MPDSGGDLALGRAIDKWSSCEAWVASIFSDLIQVEIDIGHAIMASLTAGPKRELLERIALLVKMPNGLRIELRDICKEFDRLTSQRNRIVHGDWIHLVNGTSYRVGTTKHLRYFDRWRETGADPQKAIFTLDMIRKFAKDCHALMMRFFNLAESEQYRKRFPSV